MGNSQPSQINNKIESPKDSDTKSITEMRRKFSDLNLNESNDTSDTSDTSDDKRVARKLNYSGAEKENKRKRNEEEKQINEEKDAPPPKKQKKSDGKKSK